MSNYTENTLFTYKINSEIIIIIVRLSLGLIYINECSNETPNKTVLEDNLIVLIVDNYLNCLFFSFVSVYEHLILIRRLGLLLIVSFIQ